MKKILLFIVVSALALSASAQRLDMFLARLAAPDSLGRRTVVNEHGNAATAIDRLDARPRPDKVRGYRVRIFFDNSQSARTLALSTQSRFRELFPDIPTYMVYENPYFKVTVGNCLTNEEAIILWGRIKWNFDRAFVVREEFPIEKLAE